MFRNLNAGVLGIGGRQSEVIELALTHGFKGIDLDFQDFVKRAQTRGVDAAKQFLVSSRLHISSFELPVKWRGDQAVFTADLAQFRLDVACVAALKPLTCVTDVSPESDELPFHENFEQTRQRLAEIGELLKPHGIRLGVRFHASADARQGKQYPFIASAESMLMLLKSVVSDNVGLALDTWDWYVGGGDLSHLKALGVKRIVTVTCASAPADRERSSLTQADRLLPTREGVIDHGGLYELLQSGGYQGPLSALPTLECFTGLGREAVAKRAAESLQALAVSP